MDTEPSTDSSANRIPSIKFSLPRKAIQIPSEVVAAGMQPNPRMDVSVENSTEKVVPVANPGLVSPR